MFDEEKKKGLTATSKNAIRPTLISQLRCLGLSWFLHTTQTRQLICTFQHTKHPILKTTSPALQKPQRGPQVQSWQVTKRRGGTHKLDSNRLRIQEIGAYTQKHISTPFSLSPPTKTPNTRTFKNNTKRAFPDFLAYAVMHTDNIRCRRRMRMGHSQFTSTSNSSQFQFKFEVLLRRLCFKGLKV